MTRFGTYLGLAIIGAVSMLLLARPYFVGPGNTAMDGGLRLGEVQGIETDGWFRLRVTPVVLRPDRVIGRTIADIAQSVCQSLQQQGQLNEQIYRLDVSFEGLTEPGKAVVMPYSIPIDEGACAAVQDQPNTRIVYPGKLAGWQLGTGGVLRVEADSIIRFVGFEPRSGGGVSWPFPFELACAFIIDDRTARQFLHSIQVALPQAGTSRRFAVAIAGGPAGDDVMQHKEFTLGRSSCYEVEV